MQQIADPNDPAAWQFLAAQQNNLANALGMQQGASLANAQREADMARGLGGLGQYRWTTIEIMRAEVRDLLRDWDK